MNRARAACQGCGAPVQHTGARRCGVCWAAWRAAILPRCAACGGGVRARNKYCGPCWEEHKHLARGGPAPPAPPTGPVACPACGLIFRAAIVRSAHTLCGTRCLSARELTARGWRRLATGWALPEPERHWVREEAA